MICFRLAWIEGDITGTKFPCLVNIYALYLANAQIRPDRNFGNTFGEYNEILHSPIRNRRTNGHVDSA